MFILQLRWLHETHCEDSPDSWDRDGSISSRVSVRSLSCITRDGGSAGTKTNVYTLFIKICYRRLNISVR